MIYIFSISKKSIKIISNARLLFFDNICLEYFQSLLYDHITLTDYCWGPKTCQTIMYCVKNSEIIFKHILFICFLSCQTWTFLSTQPDPQHHYSQSWMQNTRKILIFRYCVHSVNIMKSKIFVLRAHHVLLLQDCG